MLTHRNKILSFTKNCLSIEGEHSIVSNHILVDCKKMATDSSIPPE